MATLVLAFALIFIASFFLEASNGSPVSYGKIAAIINGGISTPKPFFVQITALDFKENGYEAINCGGSIIGHEWVLTAAHCVTSNEHTFLESRDFTNPSNHGIAILIKDIFRHHGYVPGVTSNLALIQIVARFNVPQVVALCGLREHICVPAATCGMGAITLTNDYPAPSLRSAPMMEFSSKIFDECPREFICARSLNRFVQRLAEGDEGSPLYQIENGRDRCLYGVASHFREVQGTHVNYFTSVPYFLDWIREITSTYTSKDGRQ